MPAKDTPAPPDQSKLTAAAVLQSPEFQAFVETAKAWVRQEIAMAREGHSDESRQRINP